MESSAVCPFYVWLLSQSIMSSRCICVVPYVRITFLFEDERYSVMGRDHILCIHSSVDGHLSCFHLPAVVNRLLWTLVYKYFFKHVSSSFVHIPRRGTTGSKVPLSQPPFSHQQDVLGQKCDSKQSSQSPLSGGFWAVQTLLRLPTS